MAAATNDSAGSFPSEHTGGRYDALLGQVQQVQVRALQRVCPPPPALPPTPPTTQHELQLARVVIQQLREDNDALKSNWETCRAQLIETRTKYNAAKEGLLEATERQIKADRKHESLVESWKGQLQQRTEDLEVLQVGGGNG